MTKLNSTIDSSPVALRLRVSVALVLIVGIGLSLGAFFFWRGVENDRMQIVFREAAHDRIHHLESEIESSLETVLAISALFDASREVERLEFRAFTEPFLSRFRGVQALEWIPRVPDAKRATYEMAAQRDGLPNFQITVQKAQGDMVKAEQRKEYFPVYFVEPLKGNEAAVGFDLASNPTRLEVLNRS